MNHIRSLFPSSNVLPDSGVSGAVGEITEGFGAGDLNVHNKGIEAVIQDTVVRKTYLEMMRS